MFQGLKFNMRSRVRRRRARDCRDRAQGFLPLFLGLAWILALGSCGKGKEEAPSSRAASPVQAGETGRAYRSEAVQNGGTISGRVLFKGKWTPSPLPVAKDQEVCGKSKQDSSLIVSQRGEVENAVVYIPDIRRGKKMEPRKVTLDQKGCEYRPHVLAFPAGSTVEILNPDGILHNVHSYSEKNEPFNLAQPKFKKTLAVEVKKPEIISVKCDVHGWMSGWFFVAENPYFSVTDNTGSFRLTNVPSGDYTLEVWHEKLGRQSKKITVTSSETVEIRFEWSSPVT